MRARKRNRVFLQFNFTGVSTREAFTSAGGTDLLVPPPRPTPPASPALGTSLRSRKVTRNLADLPPEFRLNITHVVDERCVVRFPTVKSKVKPRRSDYPFLFLLIPSAGEGNYFSLLSLSRRKHETEAVLLREDFSDGLSFLNLLATNPITVDLL